MKQTIYFARLASSMTYALVFLLITSLSTNAHSQQDYPPGCTPMVTPNSGAAVIDGLISDWDLTTDFLACMFEAGDADKDLLSKAYMKASCIGTNEYQIYVLVLMESGETADISASDAWVKIYDIGNSTLVDGNSGSSFAWLQTPNSGYEATFTVAAAVYNQIEIHINTDGRTSSSGKRQGPAGRVAIPLTLPECDVMDCPDASITGNNSYCEGTSGVTLDAGEWTSYLWSPGGATSRMITATEGSYTVMVTNADGCMVMSDPFVVTENMNPAPAIMGSTTICSGESTMLDAGMWDTYKWSPGGEETPTITAMAGTYSVVVTDDNGCLGTSAMFTVSESSGLTPMITGASNYCETESGVELDAGDGYDSYIWSPGGETTRKIATSAGSYTVTVMSGSCSGTSDPFVVTEDKEPLSAGMDQSLKLCLGMSNDLSSLVPVGGTFSDPNTTGALMGSVFNTANVGVGTYVMDYTMASGNTCPDDVAKITVNVVYDDTCIDTGDFSFLDPCDCADSRNKLDDENPANSLIYSFVEFSGEPNQDIQLTAQDGKMLSSNGVALDVTDNIYMVEGNAGEYLLEFYLRNGTQATFTMSINGSDFEISSEVCSCSGEMIPTMGQWALFVLALIMSSLGLIFIKNRSIA